MDKKYMTWEDIKLKVPLATVKRAEAGSDALVIPSNAYDSIIRFFIVADIDYQPIPRPSFYPKEKLDAWLKRYEELSPVYCDEEPVLLITPFDAEALFQWTTQICGLDLDPSYRQFRMDEIASADEFYHNEYAYRP